MVLATILAIVGATLMVAGARMVIQSSKETKFEARYVVEAESAARAGILDALQWFKRQTGGVHSANQNYFPWCDMAFNPSTVPIVGTTDVDTIDASVGLVREFPLSSLPNGRQLWMRYEVRRQKFPLTDAYGSTVPTPVGVFLTPVGTKVPWDPDAVHDITGSRSKFLPAPTFSPTPLPGTSPTPTPLVQPYNGQGSAWQITSVGYTFIKAQPSMTATMIPAFNVPPNQVLSKARASTEFRSMTLNLPSMYPAAVYATNLSSVTVNSDGRIDGGGGAGVGVAGCVAGTVKMNGSPSTVVGGSVSGVPPAYLTVNSVFGVSQAALNSVADFSGNQVTALFDMTQPVPRVLSQDKLFYLDMGGPGNPVTFDDNNRFSKGSGVLFIDGDLVVLNNSYYTSGTGASSEYIFYGLVYVTGKVTLSNYASISGALIALGGVTLSNSSPSDWSAITYVPGQIAIEQQKVCQFRENRSATRINRGLPVN